MKIKMSHLKKLIREELELLPTLAEADVVNHDTGEVLTLPFELEDEYDDWEELSGSEFEVLRNKINALVAKSVPSALADDEWEDTPDEGVEELGSLTTLDDLYASARDAMTDFLTDNPGVDPQDVAPDLAAGLKWSVSQDEWSDAMQQFGGNERDLIHALAEMMVD